MSQSSKVFPSLKLSQLHQLLTSIGGATTGTKPILLSRLQHEMTIPRLPSIIRGQKTRILSIDMGIRNLAFCVADVSLPTTTSSKTKENLLVVEVVAWKRISVLSATSTSTSEAKSLAPVPSLSKADELALAKEAFTPQSLSKTAYTLLTSLLLPYKPATILIERQRFRSGSGSAIQEWTVRVNMLESMLYAVLETLKQTHQSRIITKPGGSSKATVEVFPDVYPVSPARVAAFSVRTPGVTTAKGKRKKIEKSQKIGVAEQWITNSAKTAPPSSGNQALLDPHLKVSFSGEAEKTRHAFEQKRKPTRTKATLTIAVPNAEGDGGGRKGVEEKVEEIGKLDDLADSLLQAVAWVKWESNRRKLLHASEEEMLEMARLPDD